MNLKFNLENRIYEFVYDFSEVETDFPFLKYYECSLSMGEETRKGYAEGFSSFLLRKKSLSEAWERWWLNHFDVLSSGISRFPTSSNGFAAHSNIFSAKKSSRLELIERRDVLLSWQKPGVWKRIPSSFALSFMEYFVRTITKDQGWNIEFYFVSSGSHFTVFGLLIHSSGGVLFDSASIEESINFKVLMKVALSLIRSIPFVDWAGVSHTSSFPEFAHPRDHMNFYMNTENAKAFDVHRFTDGTGRSLIKDLHGISTHELINSSNVPALAYSFHSDWEDLSWGRSSYHAGGWPHPIA